MAYIYRIIPKFKGKVICDRSGSHQLSDRIAQKELKNLYDKHPEKIERIEKESKNKGKHSIKS